MCLNSAPQVLVRAGNTSPTDVGSLIFTMHLTFLPFESGGTKSCINRQMEDVCLRFPTPAPTATAVVPAAVVPAAAGATGAAESAADCCVPAELSPMVPSGDGVGGAAGGWLTTAAGVPPWGADIMRVRVDKQNCSQQNTKIPLGSTRFFCSTAVYIYGVCTSSKQKVQTL